MSTNPGNAVGTNGAFGGRTSVNAFNDVLGMFSGRGVLQGWELAPSSGMTITVGGDGTTRDVAVAEDNIGNRTTIDNISGQPIEVEIPAAPASNSRIDLIVAYVDNPAQGSATVTDNYEACGLIVVSGTAAASPTAPDESDIRTAITTDGGAGTIAYYVVLGTVTVASGTTDIDSTMLTNGSHTGVTSDNVDWAALDSSTLTKSSLIDTLQVFDYSLSGGQVTLSCRATMKASSGIINFENFISGLKIPSTGYGDTFAYGRVMSSGAEVLQSTAFSLQFRSSNGIIYLKTNAALTSGQRINFTLKYSLN